MKRLRTLALALSLGALALTGCATGSTDDDDAGTSNTKAEADAFPVTIEHAFGSTTIKYEPKRVATLGWSDQDHVAALGVVPVGATKITYGGNKAARRTSSTPRSRSWAARRRRGTTTPTASPSPRSPRSAPT